jgi:malate dehydrogenase (oxaloacetate-decarboxylating)(NADP+)
MTITKRGIDLLHDPKVNKSTAFTETERQAFGLVGLVPDVTESMETQMDRVLMQLKHKATDLDRFIYLMNLLDTNQTLFYHTLMSDPARVDRPADMVAFIRQHVYKFEYQALD